MKACLIFQSGSVIDRRLLVLALLLFALIFPLPISIYLLHAYSFQVKLIKRDWGY